ncbi:MAG TPA: hypothetical protein VKH42_09540 [Vicinamibacterales bacterium]|nr:hypothetical protein [Vicinamibacterales bacterium]
MRRLIPAAILAITVIGAAACARAPESATAPSPGHGVDVLDYLVGDASLWPRVGSFSQNQFVDRDRQQVCWVKYANARRFECWHWDDAYVYHDVDHALDGDSPDSYHFTDGRWMPRYLDVGEWRLDAAGNRIVWFDASCNVTPSRSGLFPYRQRVWIEKRRDTGTDLGIRDVLVLEYQPYDPVGSPGPAEQFSFARGAGWYQWDRSPAHVVFSRVGGPSVLPRREIVCSM